MIEVTPKRNFCKKKQTSDQENEIPSEQIIKETIPQTIEIKLTKNTQENPSAEKDTV